MYTPLDKALEGLKMNSVTALTVNEPMSLSGAARIANRMKGNRALRTLALNSCDLSDEHLFLISQALKHGCLRTIYLGSNRIQARGAKELMEAAMYTSSLEIVSLYENTIGDEGAILISEYLPRLRLVSLDLSRNAISDVGGLALARGLATSFVRDLTLSFNQLSDVAGTQVALSVKLNPRIETLNLDGNSAISDQTALVLLDAIHTHASLKNLKVLPDTDVTEDVSKALMTRLRIIHSKRARMMTMLCSATVIRRLSRNSPCRHLNKDIIFRICSYLRFDDDHVFQ